MRFICMLVVATLVSVTTAMAQPPVVVQSFPTTTIPTSFPGGLGYDTGSDLLYIGDSTANKIFITSRTGTPVGTIDTAALALTNPIGIGVDSAGQFLYIADEKTTNGEVIWKYDLLAKSVVTMAVVSSTNTDISGLDYNPITNTIVTSADGPAMIWEYDQSFNAVASVSLSGIAADADGLGLNTFNGCYLAGDDTGKLLVEIADDGHVLNSYVTTTFGVNDPEGVAMDPANGNVFIVTTVAPHTIYEISGGLTIGPALTATATTVPANSPVTFTTRSDPNTHTNSGMALVALGGAPLQNPLILVNVPTPSTGKVSFTFQNPGLGGITATLIGAAYNTTPPTALTTNLLTVTLQ